MNECLVSINYYVLYGRIFYNVFIKARWLFAFPNEVASPLVPHFEWLIEWMVWSWPSIITLQWLHQPLATTIKHMSIDGMVVTNYHNIPLTSSAPLGSEVDVMVIIGKNSSRLPYIHIFAFKFQNRRNIITNNWWSTN